MKRIVVASGKGGTGKTTVAVALALALDREMEALQVLDCDVEAPNAALLMGPSMDGSKPVALSVPHVETDKCTGCGVCRDLCQYNAVAIAKGKALIFESLCHACGGCSLVCPEGAIKEEPKVIGRIESGECGNIRFLQGILNVGEPMATPVIRALKADASRDMLTILDAPPGTACPVIATVKGCDYCILVTEPTPFGLYDLDLMAKVVRALAIPAGIVVNKDDGEARDIVEFAEKASIPILMRIPFSREIAVSYSVGMPLNRFDRSWDGRFRELYESIGSDA